MILEALATFILKIFLLPVMGIVSLFISPFDYAYLGFSLLLFTCLFSVTKIWEFIIKRKVKSVISFLTLAFSQILLWSSHAISYNFFPEKSVDTYFPYNPIASAGFPRQAFLYPVPPMGADYPPIEMWRIFFMNYLFWFFIAAVITILIPRKFYTSKIVAILYIIAVYSALFGLGHTIIAFD